MAKPDGQLTLPGDFGRRWADWYIAKVRVRLDDGNLGSAGFHKEFSGKLEVHLGKLPKGRDIVLRLTESDKKTLTDFTLSHCGKPESQERWEACIQNKWEPIKPVEKPKLKPLPKPSQKPAEPPADDLVLTPERRRELEIENAKPIPTWQEIEAEIAARPKPEVAAKKLKQPSLM